MRYEDRTFENQTLVLDNNEYVRCVFNKCTIEFSGGGFELTTPRLINSKFTFKGAALSTLQLIKFFGMVKDSLDIPDGIHTPS